MERKVLQRMEEKPGRLEIEGCRGWSKGAEEDGERGLRMMEGGWRNRVLGSVGGRGLWRGEEEG